MTEPSHLTAHARIPDHVAAGLALLVQELRGRPALDALLGTWLAQVQSAEDALWSLYGLGIDDSAGGDGAPVSTDPARTPALDQLGVVLGQPRPDGLADVPYRRVLRAAVVALTSSGGAEDLLRAARELFGDWPALTESFPAAMLVRPTSPPDVPAAVSLAVLRRVKGGGVSLQVVDVRAGNRFRFSASAETPTAGSARGFGDGSTPGLGGGLVGVVT
jgi:hypothetical protein